MSAARAIERCLQLAEITEQPGSICRRFATPALVRAGDLIAGWLADAGLEVARDGLGNLRGRTLGGDLDQPAIVLGSHYDTVPNGGAYDGALGVTCAIEVAERRRGGCGVPLEVHAFADEEGVRFGTAYLGSSAVFGSLDVGVGLLRDADGIDLRAALATVGGDLERRLPVPRARCYLELHIEQGPVLEQLGAPLGIVTSIAGQTRLALSLRGVAGHAGTVPMATRRDALAAAAEIVLAVERGAPAGGVATVGSLRVDPGAANVIAGAARLSLDLRHADDAVREGARTTLIEESMAICRTRGVELAVDQLFDEPAVPCAPMVEEALGRAIDRLGLARHELASGAGHDAVAIAPHCPVGMLFVRCDGGISHHPAESVDEDDVAAAIAVLAETLEELV